MFGDVDQARLNFGRTLANSVEPGPNQPMMAEVARNIAECRPKTIALGPLQAKVVPDLTKVGRFRQDLTREFSTMAHDRRLGTHEFPTSTFNMHAKTSPVCW